MVLFDICYLIFIGAQKPKSLLELSKNPEDDNCTNDATDEVTNPRVCVDADKAEKPATDTTADDTKDEINDQTIAAAALQLACDVA